MRPFRSAFLSLILLLCVRSAEAQAVRYDYFASTTSAQCAPGKQCPLNVLPGTQVNICGGTVTTLSTCLGAPATTYTNAGAGTPCPTTAQLTPATGGACLATADNQGGYGFWILPGSYNYFLRVPATAGGGTYGPYPLALGASEGCPSGATCDANYSSLAAACMAAGSGTLYVTRAWNATPTQNLCKSQFLGTGKISMAGSAVLTVTGTMTAPPSQQIFDLSASGSAVYFAAGATVRAYPQWFESSIGTDDTVAIQDAIDSCRGTLSGGQYVPVCAPFLQFSPVPYVVKGTIKLHSASAPYRSMVLDGEGKDRSLITADVNSASTDVIHMVGFFQRVSRIGIHLASAARDVISYDGVAGIGASSGGLVSEVEIECNNFQANGITGGRGAFQADQAKIDHPFIVGCGKGYGIATLDPNAVAWNVYAPSISHGWVGIATATSSTMNVYGGEVDYMQTNFYPGAGSVMHIDGVRSEGSERGWFTTVGAYQQPLTVTGGQYAAPTATRQATTGSGTATTNTLTISQCTLNTSPNCFVPGDNIVIAGAGGAGAALHVQITGYAALWTVVTISQNISTTVSGASVTLDATAIQPAFVEAGFGPYIHHNFNVNATDNWAFQRNTVGGPQIFDGVSFLSTTTNPFGLTTQSSCGTSNASWRGMTSNLSSLQDFAQIQANAADDVTTSRPIYVNIQHNDIGSSNNHIVATSDGWCYWPLHEGMTFAVELFGISLQAGANDFKYGGNNVQGIFSSRTFNSNISTPYGVNGVITLVYSAGEFHDVSQ